MSITIKKAVKRILKYILPHGLVIRLARKHRVFGLYAFTSSSPQLQDIKKVFYVIRREPPGAGLFSNFHWVLGHVIYALENNYIPIVDMEHYKTYYNENEPLYGTENAWEYYFEQPSPYRLDDVYNGKGLVILSRMEYFAEKLPLYSPTKQEIDYLHELCVKYLPFNKRTLEKIYAAKKRLFGDKKNILGILYRGTDYHLKPQGHAVIAPIDDYINKTKQCLEDWEMDWVYLITEETETVELFRKHFMEKLIVTKSRRIKNYSSDKGCPAEIKFWRRYDKYLKGLEYIIDTVLLSECDALIGPKVGGTFAALELNGNKYKHKYLYDLGVNP